MIKKIWKDELLGGIQIKIITRCYFTLIRIAVIKLTETSGSKYVEKQEPSYISAGDVK